MTADLPVFLLARIAEDEAAARAASPGPWRLETYLTNPPKGMAIWVGEGFADENLLLSYRDAKDADITHIARHNPAQVLAECEAKRQIIERESRWRRQREDSPVVEVSHTTEDPWVTVSYDRGGTERMLVTEYDERFTEPAPPSATLRLLALPYAGHRDYREEWKP